MMMMMTATLSPLLSVRGQSQDESLNPGRVGGKTPRSYVASRATREIDGLRLEESRPDWVEAAVQLATNHLGEHKEAAGLRDAKSELTLMRADEDDLGLTHVRMKQWHNGVEVYGGQLVAHLRDSWLSNVSGRVFPAADVNTTPAINEDQALEAARAALNGAPEAAAVAEAQLVVLPHSVFKGEKESGATLTYQVALQADSGSGPQLYQCFIDANDGRLIWGYNDTQTLEQGWGYSLYSGTVPLRTSFESRSFPQFSVYLLADGATSTYDMNNQVYGTYSQGQLMEDWDNYWGDWTQGNRQSAAADVHFGMNQSRDYFFYRQNGWRGLDNRGNGINAGVHYGTNYSNAFCNGLMLSFGDGGMSFVGNTRPWVSLDIVGHEYTHAIIKFTSRLKYEGESGAINESLADIFGTGVEHYAHETYPNNPGLTANYTIAEKIFTSSPDGNLFLRSLENPPLKGQPDYYPNRVYQGFCTPQGDPTRPGFNDSCGVHTNSGIMNKVFSLLAQGGTHRGVAVPKIGRAAAENIFFRAMVYYLTETSNFGDAYIQTSRAAAEVPGLGDFYYYAVSKAWQAVGVISAYPRVIARGDYVLRAKHSGKVLSVFDYSLADGGSVTQWDNAGYDNQKWLIEAVGDGYYRVTAKHSSKVLSVHGYSLADGGIIDQWANAGYDNQKWLFVSLADGYYALIAKHSQKALDIYGLWTTNGAIAHQWDYWGGDNQKWRLERVY
jgi:Zn-dependent metalloprotease